MNADSYKWLQEHAETTEKDSLILPLQMTVKSFECHINAASCTHAGVTLALIDPVVFTLP